MKNIISLDPILLSDRGTAEPWKVMGADNERRQRLKRTYHRKMILHIAVFCFELPFCDLYTTYSNHRNHILFDSSVNPQSHQLNLS